MRANPTRFVLSWGPVVAWMLVVFLLSAQSQFPTPESQLLDLLVEKTAHTLEFAILAALLVRALRINIAAPWHVLGLAVLVAAIYALTDELHQKYVPGRSADWGDVAFDWLGAVIGAAFAFACIGAIKRNADK